MSYDGLALLSIAYHCIVVLPSIALALFMIGFFQSDSIEVALLSITQALLSISLALLSIILALPSILLTSN